MKIPVPFRDAWFRGRIFHVDNDNFVSRHHGSQMSKLNDIFSLLLWICHVYLYTMCRTKTENYLNFFELRNFFKHCLFLFWLSCNKVLKLEQNFVDILCINVTMQVTSEMSFLTLWFSMILEFCDESGEA
jgi:hypothetical protein